MVELGKPMDRHLLVINNLPEEAHLNKRHPLHKKIDLNRACDGRIAEFRSLEPQQYSLVIYCKDEEDLREARSTMIKDQLRGFKQVTTLEKDSNYDNQFVLMCTYGKRN